MWQKMSKQIQELSGTKFNQKQKLESMLLESETGDTVSDRLRKAHMLNSFFTSAIPNEDTTNVPVFESCCYGIVLENFGITEA